MVIMVMKIAASFSFSLFLLSLLSLLGLALTLGQPAVASNDGVLDIESKITSRVDHNQAEMWSLLKKVVNINSGTMNFAGVRQVSQIFEKEFQQLGCETQWLDGKTFSRAGHLLASCGNKDVNFDGRKILMIGHLDTVFASDSEFQSYSKINKGLVGGPGITDMKGGDVIIIAALRALKESGTLNQLQLKVIMTGDEEKRGSPYDLATKQLIEAGKWADIALGFEDGDGDSKTAVVSRRGSIRWQLDIVGRPAHSSQIFRDEYGYGAIFEAARILNQFRLELSSQANLTFNPGVIVGGTDVEYNGQKGRGTAFGKNNVIAQSTSVSGDIRALSIKQLQHAKATMQQIVGKNLNQTSATLVFFSGYPPMSPSDGNNRLLSIYSKVSDDLGFGSVLAVDPRKAGAADISFVANYVDMALDGLGLMGSGGHTVKEAADISSLSSQTKRAAILIYRLSIKQ